MVSNEYKKSIITIGGIWLIIPLFVNSILKLYVYIYIYIFIIDT